jgi:hypothetical protein
MFWWQLLTHWPMSSFASVQKFLLTVRLLNWKGTTSSPSDSDRLPSWPSKPAGSDSSSGLCAFDFSGLSSPDWSMGFFRKSTSRLLSFKRVTTLVKLGYLHDLVCSLLYHRGQIDLDDSTSVEDQAYFDVRGVEDCEEVPLDHVVLSDELAPRHPLAAVHAQARELLAKLCRVLYKPQCQLGRHFHIERLQVEVFY